LTNKTSAPYGEEVSWMKPILRFFSMNFLRAFCLDAEREYMGPTRLSTFFQIDLEVIRIMRSKDFSFAFAKNIGKFMILGRDIEKVRSLCKFWRVSLNI